MRRGKSSFARRAAEAAAKAGKRVLWCKRDSGGEILGIPFGRDGQPIIDPDWHVAPRPEQEERKDG